MNKQELINEIATLTGQTQAAVKQTLNGFERVVGDALVKGDSVALIGFGTFSVAERAARTGRNPATGQVMEFPATKVARFKVGSLLKDRVRDS